MGTFVQAGRGIAEKTPFGSKWFYAGFLTLVDDNKWIYTKAEQWLCAAVSQALLEPLHDNAGSAARSAKTRATRGGLSAKRRPNRPK
jgi:hypothetical protein